MTSAQAPAVSTQTRTLGLVLDPLDVLFIGDGRPFGGAVRGQSLPTPLPQTLAGAIWTALLDAAGCDFTRLRRAVSDQGLAFAEALGQQGLPESLADIHVRGPWLARFPSGAMATGGPLEPPEVFVPVPAVLHKRKGADDKRLLRLAPLPSSEMVPGWNRTPSGRRYALERPLWIRSGEATEPVSGLIGLEALEGFLRGETPAATDLIEQQQLVAFDHRTGIAIDPASLTAAETYIYTASFAAFARSPRHSAGLYAEVALPESAAELLEGLSVLRLGGEGRSVAMRTCATVRWPDVEPKDGENTLLVLTTPGLFAAAWRPRLPDGLNVVAAAVPGGLALSGWDLARGGPKPARFAVPAGSTYFLQGPARDLPRSLAEDDLSRQQGWSCYVRGVWKDQ